MNLCRPDPGSPAPAELQGIYTAQEINTFLKEKGEVDDYPLFKAVRSLQPCPALSP